jgi:hypothetical protein
MYSWPHARSRTRYSAISGQALFRSHQPDFTVFSSGIIADKTEVISPTGRLWQTSSPDDEKGGSASGLCVSPRACLITANPLARARARGSGTFDAPANALSQGLKIFFWKSNIFPTGNSGAPLPARRPAT